MYLKKKHANIYWFIYIYTYIYINLIVNISFNVKYINVHRGIICLFMQSQMWKVNKKSIYIMDKKAWQPCNNPEKLEINSASFKCDFFFFIPERPHGYLCCCRKGEKKTEKNANYCWFISFFFYCIGVWEEKRSEKIANNVKKDSEWGKGCWLFLSNLNFDFMSFFFFLISFTFSPFLRCCIFDFLILIEP